MNLIPISAVTLSPFMRKRMNAGNIKAMAAEANFQERINWYMHYTNLYQNIYEWTGMPETVNLRFLEETLYYDGKALFFNDSDYGFMCLPCSFEGGYNVYWEPLAYRAISNNYSKRYTSDECVLIRENENMYPPVYYVDSETVRIADTQRTLDVIAAGVKSPWLITTDIDDKLTYKTLIDEINNNEIFVAVNKRIGGNPPNAYPNRSNADVLSTVYTYKHEMENTLKTKLGINCSNTDKRERLVVDEANANNIELMLNIDKSLDWRKKACDEINAKFNLNVSVDIKHDYVREVLSESNNDDIGLNATNNDNS